MSVPDLAKLMGQPRDTDTVTLLVRAAILYPEVAALLFTRCLRTRNDRWQAVEDIADILEDKEAAA